MAPEFYGWSDPRDQALVAPLEAELRQRQTPLLPFDPDAAVPDGAAALVIFLSDRLLATAGARLEPAIESWPGPIVPVALTGITDAPSVLASLSWIEGKAEPIETVAGRVALSARTRPRWLLGWQEVRAAAGGGQEGRPLLEQGALDRAEDIVRKRPRDLLPEVPPEVLTLLRESRNAIARRRRQRFVLALAAVLLLTAIAAVAFQQRHSATVAEAHAKRALVHSEADRLSRLADQGLETDPDLPVLLARRAYRLEPGPRTWESLRRAVDVAPWHRSYRLGTAPERLAASPRSPLVAVVASDGSISLLDSRTGRRLARVPRPAGARNTPVLSVSADGRRIASAYDGGLVQVRRFDPSLRLIHSTRLSGLGDSSSLSVVWTAGDQGLLMAWSDHPALFLDPVSGRSRELRVGGGLDDPISVATSSSTGLVALAGRHAIAILRGGTMRPCWSAPRKSPDAVSLVFDDRHRSLVVARESLFALQIPIPARCGPSPERQPEREPLISIEGDAAVALPGGGVAVGASGGEVALVEPPAIHEAGRFLAHVSEVKGIGVVAGGSLVTVGEDRWMRVWQPPRVPEYPIGPAWSLSLNESYAFSDTRASWRPMIASDESGSTVTLGGFSSGTFAVIRASHLDKAVRSFFIAIASSIRPSGASPCAALMFNGTATLFRCRGSQLHPIWSHSYTDEAQSLFQTALAADGRTVAVAGLDSVYLTRAPDGPTRRFEYPNLEALNFDRRNDLFVLGGDGSILEAKADGGRRRVAVPLHGCRYAAGAVAPSGKKAVLLCLDGEVLVASTANGRVRSRFTVKDDLSEVIDVRLSPDGGLAVIVTHGGYRVLDLEKQRVIAGDSESEELELGAQPRDATFLGSRSSLLVLRADEGLTSIELGRWRFLDGAALLRATAAAAPRPLGAVEAREPAVGLER
jgi:hypothetical protein